MSHQVQTLRIAFTIEWKDWLYRKNLTKLKPSIIKPRSYTSPANRSQSSLRAGKSWRPKKGITITNHTLGSLTKKCPKKKEDSLKGSTRPFKISLRSFLLRNRSKKTRLMSPSDVWKTVPMPEAKISWRLTKQNMWKIENMFFSWTNLWNMPENQWLPKLLLLLTFYNNRQITLRRCKSRRRQRARVSLNRLIDGVLTIMQDDEEALTNAFNSCDKRIEFNYITLEVYERMRRLLLIISMESVRHSIYPRIMWNGKLFKGEGWLIVVSSILLLFLRIMSSTKCKWSTDLRYSSIKKADKKIIFRIFQVNCI